MAMAEWQVNQRNPSDISVSHEAKMNLKESILRSAGRSAGRDSRLEMKATWKDTKIWLAMTQPFSRYDLV